MNKCGEGEGQGRTGQGRVLLRGGGEGTILIENKKRCEEIVERVEWLVEHPRMRAVASTH